MCSAPSSGTGQFLVGGLICVLAVGVILLFTLLVRLALGFLTHRVPPLVSPFREEETLVSVYRWPSKRKIQHFLAITSCSSDALLLLWFILKNG